MLRGQRIIARELEALGPGARVLSVGEGWGTHFVDLATRFPQLRFVAIELDPVRADAIGALVRQHGLRNAHAIRGDASRMPFADRAFRFVYVRSVLQFLADPSGHVREAARITDGVVLYRDNGNWPFYPILRRIQSFTLGLRRRPGASDVLRDARIASATSTIRWHATRYARWVERAAPFWKVTIVGHDFLWWDADRHLPLVGLVGARFGLRCTVAPAEPHAGA